MDPKDIFASNRDSVIMEKLANKFVGICYMSCLILKINKIIRRSYVYMKDTLDGDAQTNIQFEVDAIVYRTNEVINGCKIIKKEPNGIIHAKSEYAGIQLSIQPNMSIFKEGDIVPVLVKRVRYNINQPAASVLAVPFMPVVYNPIYYNISGELSKIQKDEIKYLLSQIDATEKEIHSDKFDKKVYQFFIELMNPIKSKDKPENKGSRIDIKHILDIKTGVIFRQDNKYDTAIITCIDSIPSDISKMAAGESKPAEIIDESIYIALYSILCNHLMNLQTIMEFLKYYPDFASVQINKDIWKMYSILKK